MSLAYRMVLAGPGLLVNVDDAHIVTVYDAASVVFTVIAASAASGIVLTFEGRISEGDPWVIIAAGLTNSTSHTTKIAASAPISAVPAFGWVVPTFGFGQVRARVSARTGGAVTVRGAPSGTPL